MSVSNAWLFRIQNELILYVLLSSNQLHAFNLIRSMKITSLVAPLMVKFVFGAYHRVELSIGPT